MRLATFTHAGTTRIGVVTGDAIVDLGRAAPALPHDMVRFLETGREAFAAARAAATDADARLHLSTAFTLEPGDVVTTGTPSGVGGAMQPPRFLQVGDVVRIEIEKLGAIENRIVAEPGGMIL